MKDKLCTYFLDGLSSYCTNLLGISYFNSPNYHKITFMNQTKEVCNEF